MPRTQWGIGSGVVISERYCKFRDFPGISSSRRPRSEPSSPTSGSRTTWHLGVQPAQHRRALRAWWAASQCWRQCNTCFLGETPIGWTLQESGMGRDKMGSDPHVISVQPPKFDAHQGVGIYPQLHWCLWNVRLTTWDSIGEFRPIARPGETLFGRQVSSTGLNIITSVILPHS